MNLGTRTADFEVLKELGQGSYGTVYQVKGKNDGTIWAVKKIGRRNGIDPMQEFNAQQAVAQGCPYVVQIFAAWGTESNSDYLYVQMEFCSKGSLQDVWNIQTEIKETIEHNQFTVHPDNQRVPSAQLVLEQIAEALIACEERGLAHLDIKPANILVVNLSHVKLADFGQVLTTTQAGNHAGVHFRGANSAAPGRRGTEGFIAPEMGVTTNMDWSTTDIYSLCSTTWMLVMLQWPEEADKMGPGNPQLRVSEENWPPLPGRGRPGLVKLVNSMLRTTQPELRPPAREVKAFFQSDDGS